MSCKIYDKQHTLDQSKNLVYDVMLMTKEFKHSDSNTMMFMGNKPLFALIKWRERAYKISLGVEKPLSSEPCLKASSLPTNCSLVLAEFDQSLDAIT